LSPGVPIRKPNKKSKRDRGHICHVGESRSAGYWLVIKSDGGDVFFAYGANVINRADAPRIGRNVEYTPLPAAVGSKLGRATEVQILPPSKTQRKIEKIVLVRLPDGLTRITVGYEGLGELKLD
jgi:hypothetical protein